MGMSLDGVDGSVDLLDFSNARLHLELQIIAIVWLCECVRASVCESVRGRAFSGWYTYVAMP